MRAHVLLAVIVASSLACAVDAPEPSREPAAITDPRAAAAPTAEPESDDPSSKRPVSDRCADAPPPGWSPSAWAGVCHCVEQARVWRSPAAEADCFAHVPR